MFNNALGDGRVHACSVVQTVSEIPDCSNGQFSFFQSWTETEREGGSG